MRDATITDEELDQLLRSDEDVRLRWVDDRRPAPPEANWWLYLLLRIESLWQDRPAEREAWARLAIWLLARAGPDSAFARRQVAEDTANYVARKRAAGMTASSLPSADSLVRACLDAMPQTIDEVAVLPDRRDLLTLTHQEMLDSRYTRHLLNAAERHRADLDDPVLAAELDAWLAVKPDLV